MLSCCLKCRENTGSKNPKVVKTKNGEIMLYLNVKCVMVKNQNLSKSKKLGELLVILTDCMIFL